MWVPVLLLLVLYYDMWVHAKLYLLLVLCGLMLRSPLVMLE